jgi:hypothetical protein
MEYLRQLDSINNRIDSINISESPLGSSNIYHNFIKHTALYITKNPKFLWFFFIAFVFILLSSIITSKKTYEVIESHNDYGVPETKKKTKYRFKMSLLYTILLFIPVSFIVFIVIGFIKR